MDSLEKNGMAKKLERFDKKNRVEIILKIMKSKMWIFLFKTRVKNRFYKNSTPIPVPLFRGHTLFV